MALQHRDDGRAGRPSGEADGRLEVLAPALALDLPSGTNSLGLERVRRAHAQRALTDLADALDLLEAARVRVRGVQRALTGP